VKVEAAIMPTAVASTVPLNGAVVLSTNVTTPVVNYLINGNFSNTTCNGAVCLYNTTTYAGQVTGWRPSP
jgi:hypothetical protein